MRQGKMSMRDYVQMARHLAPCIITHPMNMFTQVNVFVEGMRDRPTHLSLERAEPATLEVAFPIALCKDLRVTRHIRSLWRSLVPGLLDLATFHKSDVRFGLQIICFRCRKSGHRATKYHAPAPISAHVVSTNNEGDVPVARPYNDRDQ